MLGISMREDPATAVAYAEQTGATFPVLMDPNWAVDVLDGAEDPDLVAIAEDTRTWQVVNFPTHIFIDPEGIVRAVVLAPMTYEEAVSYGELTLTDNPAHSGSMAWEPALATGHRTITRGPAA